ncbi:MAG TPA: hypothetical protein VKP58_08130 [Candidatus Acidoferrum sp.]|nr:hypothetical protein [Candidatus Acidoferrum sp.]
MTTNPTPPLPANTEEIRGACPVCHSAIFIEGGAVKGGGPSEEFQALENKAAACEEWRSKAQALEMEHASRDIDAPTPQTAPSAGAPVVEKEEYFL